jgi:putative ABC transport system permease protein
MSLMIVTIIALGVGANTVAFSVVYGLLLKPLPYGDTERLVNLYRIDPLVTGDNPSPAMLANLYAVPMPVFRDWREGNHVFDSVGAYANNMFTMVGGDQPRKIYGTEASSGVFSALGVQPLLGRLLTAEEDQIGAPGAVVLSHGFWQRSFDGDPAVIGRELVLDQVAYNIVGVMPADFSFPDDRQQLWTSFSESSKESSIRNGGFLQVIARLKEGVSLSQARQDMAALARGIGDAHPEEREHGIGVYSRMEIVAAPARSSVLLALSVGCLVLLIACANIAGLLLVRAIERRKELSVRAALGAGRGHLVIQMLTESLLLALSGGVLGALLAATNLQALLTWMPIDIPRGGDITVDYKVLAFAIGLTLLAGLLTGALPALRSSRTSIAEVLQQSGRGFAGTRGRGRTQAVLVVTQIGLTFAMLACAALFTKSFIRLATTDKGVDATNVLSMPVSPPDSSMSSSQSIIDLYDELTQRLLATPGVAEVGLINQMPFVSGISFPPVEVESAAGVEEEIIHLATVTPSYPTLMSIPVVKGRGFTEADREDSLPVTLVNQAMVRRFWPDEDPIGHRIRINAPDETWYTVVGVIGDVLYWGGIDAFPELYVPFAQRPASTQWVAIKTSIEPSSLIPTVRETLWSIDPDLPAWVNVYQDQINSSEGIAAPRFGALVLAILATVALILAITGIYGMLAFTVTQRTSELGIRMMLGANRRSILRGVLGRGLRLAIGGLALGTVLVVVAFRLLESGLYGISPTDPMTLVEMAIIIVAATLLASCLPARRAMNVNPVNALRQG